MSAANSPDRRRDRLTAAALAAACLSAPALGLATLAALAPGTSLLPAPSATTVPTPPRAASPADAQVASAPAAGQVLQQVLESPSAQLLGPGGRFTSPALASGPPSLPGCEPATAALVSQARSASVAGTSIRVQVHAYGAGQSARALEAVRARACSFWPSGPGPDGIGWTLRSSLGGQPVAVSGWVRGDVLVLVSATRFSGSPSPALQAVSARVDTVLRDALQGRCRDLSPSVQDASRSPYGSARYTGRTQIVTLPSLELPAVQAPRATGSPSPRPLPQPSEVPDLAPYLAPDLSQFVDGDGDGFAESPPAAEDAQRAPAPVLRDPDAFEAVRDEAEPVAPAPPQAPSGQRARYAVADPDGPGCGWSFTGQLGPRVDAAALEAAREAALAEAMRAQASAGADYLAAGVSWRAAMSTYLQAHAAWRVEQDYLAAYRSAVAAQQQAREDLSASQLPFQERRVPPAPQPVPTPTPTPSAPVPEPTQTPEPSPTPVPTPTPTPSLPAPGGAQ